MKKHTELNNNFKYEECDMYASYWNEDGEFAYIPAKKHWMIEEDGYRFARMERDPVLKRGVLKDGIIPFKNVEIPTVQYTNIKEWKGAPNPVTDVTVGGTHHWPSNLNPQVKERVQQITYNERKPTHMGIEYNGELFPASMGRDGRDYPILCVTCGYIGNSDEGACPHCHESDPIEGYSKDVHGGDTVWVAETLYIAPFNNMVKVGTNYKKELAFELKTTEDNSHVYLDEKHWTSVIYAPYWEVVNSMPEKIKEMFLMYMKVRKGINDNLKLSDSEMAIQKDIMWRRLVLAVNKLELNKTYMLDDALDAYYEACKTSKLLSGVRESNDKLNDRRILSKKATFGGRKLFITKSVKRIMENNPTGICRLDMTSVKPAAKSSDVAYRSDVYDWYKENKAIWTEYADNAVSEEDATFIPEMEADKELEEEIAQYKLEAKKSIKAYKAKANQGKVAVEEVKFENGHIVAYKAGKTVGIYNKSFKNKAEASDILTMMEAHVAKGGFMKKELWF